MPDWSYRTVFRPALFCLPPAMSRDLALGAMGHLSQLPFGAAVIDFLGHMRPDERLRRTISGLDFPSGVGLAAGIDVQARAVRAFGQFGFAFVEVGPVTVGPRPPLACVERQVQEQTIFLPLSAAPLDAPTLADRLRKASPFNQPVLARIAIAEQVGVNEFCEQRRQAITTLAPWVDLFCLMAPPPMSQESESITRWGQLVQDIAQAAAESKPSRGILTCLPAEMEQTLMTRLAQVALEKGALGIVVDGAWQLAANGRQMSPQALCATCEAARLLREELGPEFSLIAVGGVHQPKDALALFAAGADAIGIDSGLVYTGPGLAKRINEADLRDRAPSASPTPPIRTAEQSWPWSLLLGASMTVGGLLALIIAVTRVVLPYDEALAGMTRHELAAINERLLPFMTHDRATLAGTMLAVGMLYLALSQFGVRQGHHWAKSTIAWSAFAGFFTFFAFLGFEYFDPFHAFVTAVLLQLLLFAVHGRLPPRRHDGPPDLDEDAAWRLGQWGQLMYVIHGAAILVAGMTITWIGMTEVFVAEDLDFMRTTREALVAANPRLVPLVAHDRATFGGMLISCGLAVLLASLWGFCRGAAWLWWSLLAAGTIAYMTTIVIHLYVGYTHLHHLLPAYGGLAWLWLSAALTHSLLCRPPKTPLVRPPAPKNRSSLKLSMPA